MDIRAELKNLMEAKNYTTAFVAQATGISKSTISFWKVSEEVFLSFFKLSLYYIAIMIKDSPLSDDENSKIISDISKIVYQYFCINKN